MTERITEMSEARRQYGTGSIFQRKDGRWMGVLQAGWTPRGTRRTVSVSAATEKECRARLNKKRRELEAGTASASTARATVKTWADEWLPMHAKAVRPKAYTTDAGAVRRWIVPTIGTRRLSSLTPADVRAVHKAVTSAGRSTTTARHAHWTLMGMLKAAAADGVATIPAPVLAVKAPAAAAHDRDAMSLQQAMAIRTLAQGRPDAARWLLAILYGMRQAEVLGLTWDALTLDGPLPSLAIEWQLQPLPYADRAAGTFRVPEGHESRHLTGAYHLVRPKSKKGYRVVPILPALAGPLRDWRDHHAVDNPWGLVWTGWDDRPGRRRVTPPRADLDRQAWVDMQAQADVSHPTGRPFVLHEARHTAATMLMAEGVDPDIIALILGHNVMTSRAYKHADLTVLTEALGRSALRLAAPGVERPDEP